MSLKNAALLGLVGTLLISVLLIVGMIGDVLAVVRGLIPEVRLLTSVIQVFASLSVVVFFYVFHKTQA